MNLSTMNFSAKNPLVEKMVEKHTVEQFRGEKSGVEQLCNC